MVGITRTSKQPTRPSRLTMFVALSKTRKSMTVGKLTGRRFRRLTPEMSGESSGHMLLTAPKLTTRLLAMLYAALVVGESICGLPLLTALRNTQHLGERLAIILRITPPAGTGLARRRKVH